MIKGLAPNSLLAKSREFLPLEQGILSSEQGLSNRGAGYCGQQIKPCAEAGRSRTLDPVKKCRGEDKYFLHRSGQSCRNLTFKNRARGRSHRALAFCGIGIVRSNASELAPELTSL